MKIEEHKRFIRFADALETIEHECFASNYLDQNDPLRIAMLEFLQEKVSEFEKFAYSDCKGLKAQFELRQKLYNTFIRLVNTDI